MVCLSQTRCNKVFPSVKVAFEECMHGLSVVMQNNLSIVKTCRLHLSQPLLAHTVTRSTLQKKKMMVALMSFSDVFCWQLKYHIYTKGRQWSPNYTLALCALKYLERLRGKGEDRSLIHSHSCHFLLLFKFSSTKACV